MKNIVLGHQGLSFGILQLIERPLRLCSGIQELILGPWDPILGISMYILEQREGVALWPVGVNLGPMRVDLPLGE